MGGALPLVPVLSDGQRERPKLAPPRVTPNSPPGPPPLERAKREPDVVAAHIGREGEDALMLHAASIISSTCFSVEKQSKNIPAKMSHLPHNQASLSSGGSVASSRP